MTRLPFAALAFFCLALPSVVSGQELTGPAEGKARVYVFYFRGSHPRPPVQLFDGHSYVGVLASKQYYALDLDPGAHLLWSKTKSPGNGVERFLEAEVKAGRTYFVHLRMTGYDWDKQYPVLISAGPQTTPRTLKRINERLTKHGFDFQEPATAEHIEAMQQSLGPMIENVMRWWDRRPWGAEVLHESDYVK